MTTTLVFLTSLAMMALMVTASAKPQKYFNAPTHEERSASVRRPCHDITEFRCDDGECIDAEWKCDNEEDCADRSDERANCSTDCSGAHKFLCDDGRCIASEYRCDGNNDCRNGTDERDCHLVDCPPGEAKCNNHLCVEKLWFCDGENDCGDNSDETNCECRDEHSVQVCDRLNQTAHPICVGQSFTGMRYCRRFCGFCTPAE